MRRGGNGGAPRLCITLPDGLTVAVRCPHALRAELGDASGLSAARPAISGDSDQRFMALMCSRFRAVPALRRG